MRREDDGGLAGMTSRVSDVLQWVSLGFHLPRGWPLGRGWGLCLIYGYHLDEVWMPRYLCLGWGRVSMILRLSSLCRRCRDRVSSARLCVIMRRGEPGVLAQGVVVLVTACSKLGVGVFFCSCTLPCCFSFLSPGGFLVVPLGFPYGRVDGGLPTFYLGEDGNMLCTVVLFLSVSWYASNVAC